MNKPVCLVKKRPIKIPQQAAASLLQIAFILCATLAACNTHAHLSGITDTAIEITQSSVRVIFTTPEDNLKELPVAAPDIPHAIMQGLALTSSQGECLPRLLKQQSLSSLQSLQFWIDYQCPQPMTSLELNYQLFATNDATHENFVRVRMAGRNQSITLSQQNTTLSLPVEQLLKQWNAPLAATPGEDDINAEPESINPSYFKLGTLHILTGFDHLLFLLALFALPLRWKSLLLIITGFTVAHSITLSLAALHIFSLPPAFTEWMIALSIVVTAVENILQVRAQPASVDARSWYSHRLRFRWLITFGFGLLHGFGFSYLLQEIGLGENAVSSLLLFNLGVEAGQLIVLAALSPLLYWLFRSHSQRRGSLFMSAMAAAAGIFWLVERSGMF